MKLKKQHIANFIFLLFLLYGINNFIFERLFFFNEILAFLGLNFFFYQTLKLKSGSYKIVLPTSKIYRLTLCIIGLGVIQLLISLLNKTNFYYYFRGSVIVYSIFTFFIGFYLMPYFGKFLNAIRSYLWIYLIYALIFPSIALLERFMGAVFFPLLFKKYTLLSLLGVICLSLVLSFQYESLTVIIVSAIVLSLFIIPSYRFFQISFLAVIFSMALTFIYFQPNFEKYKEPPYSLFGNIKSVANSHKLLTLDGNSTWRAVFWYRLMVERFPENILGIGFGTPLIPYYENIDTVIVPNNDKHDSHVSGAHNTYLTVAVRMGILFLLLIGLIFSHTFKAFYKQKKNGLNKDSLLLFYSFFTVSAIGLFNLVLESPTGASLFWGLLGLIARSIEDPIKVSTNEK